MPFCVAHARDCHASGKLHFIKQFDGDCACCLTLRLRATQENPLFRPVKTGASTSPAAASENALSRSLVLPPEETPADTADASTALWDELLRSGAVQPISFGCEVRFPKSGDVH